MWTLSTPWYELIFRSFCIFAFLFIVFRVWGKKHFGELTAFDFLLLLIISECVQNGLVDDDKSVTGGMITALTLITLNIILNKLTFTSHTLEKIIDGVPKTLILHGKVDQDIMNSEKITDQELHEALRQQGVEKIDEVKKATIETNGKISVIKKKGVIKDLLST